MIYSTRDGNIVFFIAFDGYKWLKKVAYIRPTEIKYSLTTTIDNDKLIEWCNKHYAFYLKDETYTVDTISTVMIENYIDEHIDELVEIKGEEINSYIKDVELGSLTIVEE